MISSGSGAKCNCEWYSEGWGNLEEGVDHALTAGDVLLVIGLIVAGVHACPAALVASAGVHGHLALHLRK